MTKGPLVGRGRLAEVFAWGDNRVLKLFYPSRSADSIAQEARIGRLVSQTGVASPSVGDVIEVEGRPGIILERIDGPSMLTEMSAKPWKLIRSARTLAELHASMHNQSIVDIPAQREELLGSIHSVTALSDQKKDVIIKVLAGLPKGEALCHGDFHPDNVIIQGDGAVIIDWTTATRGNPLADVARTLLILKLGELPPGTPLSTRLMVVMGRALFHKVYLRRYFQLRPDGRQETAAWQLPIAAARMADGIDEEQDQLLSLVESLLARISHE